MTGVNQAEKTLAEQIADLVKRKPQHYDVVFSVGPKNVKVKAVKIVLKAASPVFESEFEDNWESAVVREGEGIPLPDFDPTVFELFVNLIITDTWSLNALNNLNLPPNTVLSLLGLCQHYKITKAVKNLEKAADDCIQNLYEFKDTAEFLDMSRENLETILSCDAIPLDEIEIFGCVCRWADYQCQQKKIKSTGENFRKVLGSCFFKVRFPTMRMQDFKNVSLFKKNLFTGDERLAIYDFIATEESEKAKYDKSQLLFKTNLRNIFGCSILRLPKQFRITENPAYVCNGNVQSQWFKVSKKMQLHGVGFLGPIESDSHCQFKATVQIQQLFQGSWIYSRTFEKNICDRKGKILYFLFDAPVTIEPSVFNGKWDRNECYIYYSLKGAKSVSQYNIENPTEESVRISDLEFKFDKKWNSDSPLARLLFKKN